MARILIVEDEPEIAAALAYDLKLEGYEVEVAPDGEAASVRGREVGWTDFLDVSLPKRDGFDVCRDLRKAGVRTPIVFLTARTHEAEKVLGLDLGGDDHITKPFSARELRAASGRGSAASRRMRKRLCAAPIWRSTPHARKSGKRARNRKLRHRSSSCCSRSRRTAGAF